LGVAVHGIICPQQFNYSGPTAFATQIGLNSRLRRG
jgi:hypothetical protein